MQLKRLLLSVEYYGASLVGMPVLAMGFGKMGGWAHTVNSQTSYSLYRLTVRSVGLPPDLGFWEYLMDDEWGAERFVVSNACVHSFICGP